MKMSTASPTAEGRDYRRNFMSLARGRLLQVMRGAVCAILWPAPARQGVQSGGYAHAAIENLATSRNGSVAVAMTRRVVDFQCRISAGMGWARVTK